MVALIEQLIEMMRVTMIMFNLVYLMKKGLKETTTTKTKPILTH